MATKNKVDKRDVLPPSSKRAKLNSSILHVPKSTKKRDPPSKAKSQTLEVCPTPSDFKTEFPIISLDDFYKPCPTYRLPTELGAFSLDPQGDLQLDRSQLRYFVLPPHPTKPNFDLNIGFSQFSPKEDNVPSTKLNPILRWINQNGACFRPHPQPLSPPIVSEGVKPWFFSPPGLSEGENGNVSEGHTVPGDASEGRRSSSSNHESVTFPSKERPDDLLTNFVSWRGMLTKMMCSLYDKTQPWCLAAIRHNGTIYLSEVEMDEAKKQTQGQSLRMEQMSYWGLKFEDYIASNDPPPPIKPPLLPSNPSTSVTKPGTVNAKRAYFTVVRTRMNTHSIVMAAEVDCCEQQSKEKPPRNYIELKTSRVILTDRNQSTFKRHKLMKWWAQSFLVGVPKIICGFRDDKGIVKLLQTFRTSEIPHDSQNDLTLWQPSVCLNFLDSLLSWIKQVVYVDDPRTVYLLEWKSPFTSVTCTRCPPNSEHLFFPEWYLKKQSPYEN